MLTGTPTAECYSLLRCAAAAPRDATIKITAAQLYNLLQTIRSNYVSVQTKITVLRAAATRDTHYNKPAALPNLLCFYAAAFIG